MLPRLIKMKQVLLAVLLALSMLFAAQVQAHGGLALADDMCIFCLLYTSR